MNFNYPHDPERVVILVAAVALACFFLWRRATNISPPPEPDLNDDTEYDIPMPPLLKLLIAFFVGATIGSILVAIS